MTEASNPYVEQFLQAMEAADPEEGRRAREAYNERGVPDDPKAVRVLAELEARFTVRSLSRREQRALDARREAASRERSLVAALERCIRFSAYSATDPRAIRFEFASEEDRLAAANAVDASGAILPIGD